NDNNYHSIGTHVSINPGLYREDVVILGNQYNTPLPITFEAAGTGVRLSRWVAYTNGQTYSGNSSIYPTSWANKWGDCAANKDGSSPLEQEIVLRREMIF